MTEKALEHLPGMIKEVAIHCGIDAALALVSEFQGRQIVIPLVAESGSMSMRLREVMGVDAARAFILTYGGTYISVPNASRYKRYLRNSDICSAYQEGMSVTALIERFKLTQRQIRTILKTHVD